MKNNKIFGNDGKAFVLAVDHPLNMPSPELEDISSVIERAAEGGADAFLASYGCIRNFGPLSKKNLFDGKGVILRADAGNPIRLMFGAEDALRIGADALLCMGFPFSTANAVTVANVASVASQAHASGLLAGAEMLPYGFEHPEGIDSRSVENVSFACRMGCELGADFIKTEFVGGARFSEVVRNCYSPVLVLGGSRCRSEEDILSSVREAMDAGASGVIMGRVIVRSSDMTALCKEISSIIHYRD